MAKTLFKRIEDSAYINNLEIEDGSFIVTGDGKTFVDYGENRIATSGTPDIQMSSTSTNAVQNKTIKSYVDGEISIMNTNLGGKILWTNSNPTSEFASQNITLNSSDYDMLLVLFKRARDGDDLVSEITIKGYGMRVVTVAGDGGTRRRVLSYVNTNTYNVGNGLDSNGTSINGALVPLYVIGYKTGLFS